MVIVASSDHTPRMKRRPRWARNARASLGVAAGLSICALIGAGAASAATISGIGCPVHPETGSTTPVVCTAIPEGIRWQ